MKNIGLIKIKGQKNSKTKTLITKVTKDYSSGKITKIVYTDKEGLNYG